MAGPGYKGLYGDVPFRMVPPLHLLEGSVRDLVRENLILKMSAPAAPAKDKTALNPDELFESIDRKYARQVRVYADLISLDLETWLRVPMDEMGYVYAEGGVKLGGAWGFQPFVDDLREKAPASFPGMTLKLFEAADIKELVFPQAEEFTRYTAWAALKRVLWPNADTSSPLPGPPESSTDAGSSSASSAPEPPSTSS